MAKKGTAVVFGGTSNQSFAMGTFLINLKKYAPNLADEIVIFHDGKFPEKDKKIISEIFPTRFMTYQLPIDDKSLYRNGDVSFFSKMVFSKYECLRLLDEYKTVIWSDYDITLLDNIQEIAEPTESGVRLIIWDKNHPTSAADNSPLSIYELSSSFATPISDYDMKGQRVSAGLMVFHDNLKDYQKIYDFCYQKTIQYLASLKYPEEAIFGIMLQEFALKPDGLDHDIYACHPKHHHLHPDTKIIHCYGRRKFWLGTKNAQWEEDYTQWLALGGSKKESGFSWQLRRIKRKIIILMGKVFKNKGKPNG